MEHGGIEAWFAATHEDFGVDPAKYRKITDTLDVWFDSGSDVPDRDGRARRPRDAHGLASARTTAFRPTSISKAPTSIAAGSIRRCSISCMVNGVPPYKALLTHGFAVDGEGRKMSKSKGNVVSPQKVAESLGAEILRLWVAATDYSGELTISDEILKRVVEGYRRIRNTLRFLLANTADFDRGAATRCRSRSCWRSTAIALAQAQTLAAAVAADYAPLRVPPRRAAAADLLLGGPGRLLPRRPEGPAVHGGARTAVARRSAQTALR